MVSIRKGSSPGLNTRPIKNPKAGVLEPTRINRGVIRIPYKIDGGGAKGVPISDREVVVVLVSTGAKWGGVSTHAEVFTEDRCR